MPEPPTGAQHPPPPVDTITQQQTMEQEATHDAAPPEPPSARTRHLYADCHATTGMLFTDPTGRFLTPSTSGNQYILVVYEYGGNFIHAEPMVDRKGPSIITAYKQAVSLFKSRGFKPLFQWLDNEASSALHSLMDDNGIAFQLSPPRCRRRNAAECAIHTFKNHFIAGLRSTNRDFPLNLWDKLLPQCLLTLNLLRRSRINPQLSAQAHMHGAFDFNRTPLAPPGTKVLIHEKPDTRGTWAPHAVEGWYLGPAMRHYRCYRIWAWNTSAERVADTLAWFPTATVMPRHSSTNIGVAAAHDLTHALLQPAPSSPLSPLTGSRRHRLLQLAYIFHQHTHRPDHIPSEPPAASLSLVPPPNPLPFHDPDSVPAITPPPTLNETLTMHPIERVVPFPSRWGRTRTRAPTLPHCTNPPTLTPTPLIARHSSIPTTKTYHMGRLGHRRHRPHCHLPVRHNQPGHPAAKIHQSSETRGRPRRIPLCQHNHPPWPHKHLVEKTAPCITLHPSPQARPPTFHPPIQPHPTPPPTSPTSPHRYPPPPGQLRRSNNKNSCPPSLRFHRHRCRHRQDL
jgi:hypothetical protein